MTLKKKIAKNFHLKNAIGYLKKRRNFFEKKCQSFWQIYDSEMVIFWRASWCLGGGEDGGAWAVAHL